MGPIREGQYEVVLFSHGNGGRYRNHYLTAQVLTDAGFKAMAELIAFCESGNDHDVRPMHYRLENVGHEINLATFSRLRGGQSEQHLFGAGLVRRVRNTFTCFEHPQDAKPLLHGQLWPGSLQSTCAPAYQGGVLPTGIT